MRPKNEKGLSDEYCCQLLAWLHTYGSNPNDKDRLTRNAELMEDLTYAQKVLRIYHPQGPAKNLIPILNKYLNETRGYLEKQNYIIPEWAKTIFEKYGEQIPPDNPESVLKVKRTRQRTK